MGLISENHPGMTAEIPACSPAASAPAPAPAATVSSAVSRALLAAASASIPRTRRSGEVGERAGELGRRLAAGGGWGGEGALAAAALRLGLRFPGCACVAFAGVLGFRAAPL